MLDAHGLDKPAHKGIRLVRHLVAYGAKPFPVPFPPNRRS